jgi:hypothetical protein
VVKRKALLIECLDDNGYLKLPVIKSELANYVSFLSSGYGGSWRDDEIQVLRKADSREVITAISGEDVDYLFVIVSGYGQVLNYEEEDYVSFKDRDVSIEELIGNAQKQVVIIDIFKNPPPTSVYNEHPAISFDLKSLDTRKLFDEEISKMPEGK